jgi:hypothetical protein
MRLSAATGDVTVSPPPLPHYCSPGIDLGEGGD